MTRSRRALMATLAGPWIAGSAFAQSAAPATHSAAACPQRSDAGLPAAWAGWRGPATPLAAARTAAYARATAMVEPGRAYRLTLHPQAAVKLAGSPGSDAAGPPHAGLAAIRIGEAGTYAIGLDGSGWVDFIGADGALVTESGHGAPLPCATLRKSVIFPLTPGDYTVQVASHPAPRVRLMVARVDR